MKTLTEDKKNGVKSPAKPAADFSMRNGSVEKRNGLTKAEVLTLRAWKKTYENRQKNLAK